MEVEVLEPPTSEMTRWTTRLTGPLFGADDLAARTLRTALVTPLAHVASLSFEFQCYLYAVFHRTLLSRLSHVVLMPIIVTATIATMLSISLPLGVAAALGLSAFYSLMAWRNGLALLGVLMLPVMAALSGLAWLWALSGSQPAYWMFGLALAQTLSHSLEHVPPRVSGGPDWVTLREFFLGPDDARHGIPMILSRLVRAVCMAIAGTFNELTGSWRLLPMLVVRGLWTLGYQPERRARIAALVAAAMRDDNPAVDFIGTGGARAR